MGIVVFCVLDGGDRDRWVWRVSQQSSPPSLDYVGEPKKKNNPLKEGEDEVLQ